MTDTPQKLFAPPSGWMAVPWWTDYPIDAGKPPLNAWRPLRAHEPIPTQATRVCVLYRRLDNARKD